MTFAWSWALWLAPLPWLLLRFARPAREADAHGHALAVPPALADGLDALERRARRGPALARVLLWTGWLALLVALARPVSPGDSVVQPVSGRALVLAVDLSTSMEREDFTLDGVTADRLSVVRRVVGDFVERRRGDRIGLVLFGSEAFVASAPTFDLPSLRGVLDATATGMAGRSTAIGDALGLAVQSLAGDPAAERAIVLLSDGTNNAGSVEPEDAAALSASLGVRVHAIALASDVPTRGGLRMAVSADLDEAALAAVAEVSGGRFFRARTSEELEDVYTEIDRLERAAAPAPPVIPERDWRHVPLAVALLALLVAAARHRRAA